MRTNNRWGFFSINYFVASAGDLNGDRDTELVFVGTGNSNGPRFYAASVAGFDNPVESEFSNAGEVPRIHWRSGFRIATGDADGDGRDEIAVMYVSAAGKYVVALLKAEANLRLRLLGVHTLDIAPYYDRYYPPDWFDIAFADWEGTEGRRSSVLQGTPGMGTEGTFACSP